jgi:hypothetical protein
MYLPWEMGISTGVATEREQPANSKMLAQGFDQQRNLIVNLPSREPNKKLIIEMCNEISNEFHLDILKSGRLLQHPAIL